MVANRLKELRRRAGMTLEELAEKLETSKHESINNAIKALTSSTGRFQFSVEKVYNVRYLIPSLAASSAMT